MSSNRATQWESSRSLIFLMLMISAPVVYLLWVWSTAEFIVKTKLDYADGLRLGAHVEYAGVNVGVVKQIRFLGIPGKKNEKEVFEIIFALDPTINGKPAGEIIRRNARAILISKGALGERSVNIDPGTAQAPATVNGGYIAGEVEPSVAMLIDRAEPARLNFQQVDRLLNENIRYLQQGRGTMGKLNQENNALDRNLRDLFASTEELEKRIERGKGSLARFRNEQELTAKMKRLETLTATLQENLRQPQGTVGNLLNNVEFTQRIDRLQTRITQVVDLYDRLYQPTASNNIGYFSKGMFADTRQLQQRVGRINQLLKNRQGSLGLLMYDSQLQNNLQEVSAEIAKLLYDIKQQPRKYIKFTLF
jgi:phospholipid/cholesterol/gamma-HCH transport system substrate-binding protein